MPMLGDILAAARNSSGNFQGWLERSDPELAAEIEDAASRLGMTPASYVRSAISDFSRFAGEEDWASLISAIRDSDDPGTLCLSAMVRWRLTAPVCGGHSPQPVAHGFMEGQQ